MKHLDGKTAFITGGASGIGLGMARAFGEVGMHVVVTDVRADHLENACGLLRESSGSFHFVQLDVSDRDGWARAAEEAERIYGRVDLLCNNAGVSVLGRIVDATYDDWDWALGVNLGGVVNGVQTFLRSMLATGDEAHIVSTASMAGITPLSFSGIYSVSKRAVIGLMEALRAELLGSKIGVSVLCPGLTRTNTWGTRVERPERYRKSGHPLEGVMPGGASDDGPRAVAEVAMDPLEVGRRVVDGIRRNDLYILTHAEFRDEIPKAFAPLVVAFEAAPEPHDDIAAGSPLARMGLVYSPRGRTGYGEGAGA